MRSGRERLDRAAHINNTVPENARFIGLCHLALPNARIVHMRRDPMEVCLSCFATLFKRGVHTYSMISRSLAAIRLRRGRPE